MSDGRQQSSGRWRHLDDAARWVGVVLAVAATLAVTRNGLVVSPDSTRYLAGAEGLVNGDGLVTPTGDPLVLFPPGTSIVYSIGEILPVETLTWVRVLNSLLAGASVLVTSAIVSRRVRHTSVAVAAALFTGVAVGLLAVTRAAWSEPIYVLLAAVFVALLADVVVDPDPPTSRVVALVAVVWAGCLTRYAGFVLVPVGAVAIVLMGHGRTVRRAAGFVVAASSVPLAWLIVNRLRSDSFVGERPPSTDTFPATVRRIVEVVGGWIVPADVVDGAAARLAAGIVVGSILLVALILGVRSARSDQGATRSASVVAAVASLTALAGMAMVGLTQLRTAIDPADARLLAPALVPAIVAVAMTVDRVRVPHGRPLVVTGVAFGVALVAAQATAAVRFVDGAEPEQWTYTHPVWTESAVASAIADLPDDATILTNDPFAVWALTDHRDIDESPRSGEYRSDVATPFPDDLGLSCATTYLVWFDRASVFHHRVGRIAEAAPFVDRVDLDDGQIARLARPDRCR